LLDAHLSCTDQDDPYRERRGPHRGCASHWTSLFLCELNLMLDACTIAPRGATPEHH
jgi:hypothetical protein